jgi:hypothetical protein
MHTLLSPGIHLLGRFGFARKFQVLFFLFMLPLAGSLWMIGSDYRGKLNVITSEQSGVHQLLALDTLDGQLTAQRNLAARWKALDILHTPTPAAQAAMDKVDAGNPMIMQSLQGLGEALKARNASADTLARFEALQAAVKGMDTQSLRTVGWWPDGYDRFTAALTARANHSGYWPDPRSVAGNLPADADLHPAHPGPDRAHRSHGQRRPVVHRFGAVHLAKPLADARPARPYWRCT